MKDGVTLLRRLSLAGRKLRISSISACHQHIWLNGPWLNMKMSYQYKKSHCGDKTVLISTYLHIGIFHSDKLVYWYWIIPCVFCCCCRVLLLLVLFFFSVLFCFQLAGAFQPRCNSPELISGYEVSGKLTFSPFVYKIYTCVYKRLVRHW